MRFDSLEFTKRLEQVGVSREQAEAHAELARDMLLAEVATKSDLAVLENSTKADFILVRADLASAVRELKLEIEKGDQRVVIQLTAVIVAAVGLVLAAQKLL